MAPSFTHNVTFYVSNLVPSYFTHFTVSTTRVAWLGWVGTGCGHIFPIQGRALYFFNVLQFVVVVCFCVLWEQQTFSFMVFGDSYTRALDSNTDHSTVWTVWRLSFHLPLWNSNTGCKRSISDADHSVKVTFTASVLLHTFLGITAPFDPVCVPEQVVSTTVSLRPRGRYAAPFNFIYFGVSDISP